jgi:succinoglycan biosynthesis protein ExoW
MSDKVAVVIPFYQKKQGVLTKAVLSALQQEGACPTIYIVDDASPVCARVELSELVQAYPDRIVIIEQANGGPAAARNKGLGLLPADTAFVAFLDSDDEWIPTHLSNALLAMANGFDFYFADHYQLNQTVSAFKRGGRINIAAHPLVAESRDVHAYQGDMFDQILSGNIIGTSTVVYRYEKFKQQRFREEFVYAGEDYLFWLELAKQTDRIAFSALCECTYGEGVNIFSGSGWGTENSLIRCHHEMKYKKALPRLFDLNVEQLKANRLSVKRLRRSFVADVIHRLMHRKPLQVPVLRVQGAVDPQTFLFFVPLATSIILTRSV